MECIACGGIVKHTVRKDGKNDYRCTVCGSKKKPVKEKRILVIPDLHFPFQHTDTIPFLKYLYDKYSCNTVVQIGDILDNHYSSFHDSDPDGMSANQEFLQAVESIRELAVLFPSMKVCIGNHDAIPDRKAFNGGVSKRWIRSIKEVFLNEGLPVEGWEFSENHIIDDISFVHGTGRKAKKRMIEDGISTVQGHYHAESYIDFHVNKHQKIFSMQVGALINDSAYAFAYGKQFAKSHKNAGVIINGVPTLEYMNL